MGGEQLRELGASYVAAIRDLAPKAERITDKMPLNFRFAGLIHLALPHARIIHVRRDPIDTCLSCFSKLFAGDQPYSYDLAELGRFYRYYEALMEHWRRVLPPDVMLEVQYEEVTDDLEGQARRLVAHCGLEWDDACLSFHQTQRPVQTLSAAEVRQPIYRTSVGRWRPYQRLLGPLLEALSIEPANFTATAAKPNLQMRTLQGPSVFVPFAAVVAEFTIPTTIVPPRDGTLPEVICARLPETVITRIQKLDWGSPFETLVAGLAQALQDWHGPNNLPCETSRTSSGRGLVYLGYYDEQATAQALQLGYELALLACASRQQPVDANSALVARVVQLGAALQARQPGEGERALIRAARAREIPFYRVLAGQRLWQYGQGKYGRHFLGSSSQCDSNTGTMLQHNKVISNVLVRRLGFPGVEHAVADTADNALGLANRMGYPVVIKPVDGRQGQGVTVGVTSEEEVVAAFAEANAISPGHVIIERFFEGEDVRLYVLCGRFGYAVSRSPPRLIGDGEHTVTELIDLENQRRPTEGWPKQLNVDPAMIAMLRKQNLRLNDCVPAGQIVTLRSVANASTGGTIVVVTDRVHADNQRMAEAIARCFRLDTVGIDFLTADITKSWREVRCAVIEVNSSPTILSIAPTKLLLERAFPGMSTGRIPSAVVVSTEPARVKEVVSILKREGLTAGFVERASSSIGGALRAIEHVRLAERVQALLLDPACEALVVACTPEEITEQGLPLDRCDLCVIESEVKLSEPLRGLLEKYSGRLMENVAIEAAVTRWLKDMT